MFKTGLIFLLFILQINLAFADDARNYSYELNYEQGASTYKTMSYANIQPFVSPSSNTAQDLSFTVYNHEDTNFFIGGSVNYLKLKFGNSAQSSDFINADFLSLMVMFKYFFSSKASGFYIDGGFGFTGSKGEGNESQDDVKLKGFGGATTLGFGYAIPVSNSVNINIGVQVQANAVTDTVTPYGGAGLPMLNIGVMF
jgi:hypothetical protein